jgi:hypothetical protein
MPSSFITGASSQVHHSGDHVCADPSAAAAVQTVQSLTWSSSSVGVSGAGHHGTAQSDGAWPALRVDSWTDTRDTLHMWLQIVGKLRTVAAPMVTTGGRRRST